MPMQVLIHCPGRFLNIVDFAKERDCLDSLFQCVRELEGVCKDSSLELPQCHLYECDKLNDFAFSIELERSGTPRTEVWHRGRIQFVEERNAWEVAS